MPYDLYHDTAHGRFRSLTRKFPGVTELLKTAEFEDDVSQIPDSAFAWEAKRLYPVHTPEHAIVSHMYVSHEPGVPDQVKLAVAEALTAYGVRAEDLVPVEEKVASAPEDFIFEDQTYPVRGAVEVKYAERRLLEQAARMSLPTRVEAFHKLAHAAERHGVELTPAAQAWGMAGLADPSKVIDGLAGRAALSKEARDKEAYSEVAAALRKDPLSLRPFNARLKLAQFLLRADKRAGLDSVYDKKLPDPFHTVFNTPVKLGGQMIDLNGHAFNLHDLIALPASFYGDALGPEIVGQIAPGGQIDPGQLGLILPTLPADMKSSLVQSLASTGLKPAPV